MSSSGVKKLQNLHLAERTCGLEDLMVLGPTKDGSTGDPCQFKTKYMLERASPVHSVPLADSEEAKKEKAKVAENEKYYYKSPCPEKNSDISSVSPFKSEISSQNPSLVESVAHFCKPSAVGKSNCKVFVGNISYRMKDRELREYFQLFGKVLRASICKDKKTRKSRGFGFVVFSKKEEAERAINAPEYQLNCDGRLVKVSWAVKKGKDGPNKVKALPEVSLEELARSFLDKEAFQDGHLETSAEKDDGLEEALIHKLDDDCLSQIFSYLQLKERVRLERVCKRWMTVSCEKWNLIKRLDFKGQFSSFKGATDRVLYSLLKRGCLNLQELDLSASPHFVTSVGVHMIGKMCSALRVLNLSNVALNNQNLKEIAVKCKELEVLILCRCRNFGEKGLWWFLKDAKNIKHLEVTENLRVTGRCFWMLSQTFRVLNISGCVKVDDTSIEHLSSKAPDLLSLNISNCLLISDVGLAKICTNNRQLQTLVFSESRSSVTTDGMLAVRMLTELESLDLSQSCAVNDAVLEQIVAGCTKLKHLNLQACHNGITEAGINALSKLPHLEDLDISYLSEVTDDCLAQLASSSTIKSLTCKACSQISNDGIISAILFNTLEYIDVSGCFAIDDGIVRKSQLTPRDDYLPTIAINLGGTSMTYEVALDLQKKVGNCKVLFEKRYTNALRNDFDPSLYAPFDSSEDEEDSVDQGSYFHPFSAKGYTVRSSDLDAVAPSHHAMSLEEAEDFLAADDPALLDEMEERFAFD